MLRSTWHKIVGALIVAGRSDLADKIVKASRVHDLYNACMRSGTFYGGENRVLTKLAEKFGTKHQGMRNGKLVFSPVPKDSSGFLKGLEAILGMEVESARKGNDLIIS